MTFNPRIFLADDNAGSFEFFKTMSQSAGWTIAGYASDFDSFINRAPQSDADLLLVSAGFLAVTSEADRRVLRDGRPGRVILAITDSEDYLELKAAVRAGARDCVTAGDNIAATASLLYEYFSESIAAREVSANRAILSECVEPPALIGARTAVFCSADGGTGKTFLAAQAAGMAAFHADAKTCLIDFDLRCGALSGLIGGDAPEIRTLDDLESVIDEIKPAHIENILREHAAGFSVICGPAPRLDGAAGFAEKILEPLKDMFDVVIIDLPPNAYIDFSADMFFVVVSPDQTSAKCARAMSKHVQITGNGSDISAIINRCDSPGALKAEEIARISGLEIAAEIPEDNGAGELFGSRGDIFAGSTGLALVRSLVPAVQRIRDFDELKRMKRRTFPADWGLPWAANKDA